MSQEPYQEPPWAGSPTPASSWNLEVLKGGQILTTIDLAGGEKSCFMIGRRGDLCDIVLEHPSISRLHAVLQFSKDGHLFLYDLGSTHGSTVNKKKAQPKTYVAVNVGDMLAFGESTRLYVVNGPAELMPAEYESERLKILREKLETRRDEESRTVPKSSETPEDTSVSWGFREDAVEEEEEEPRDDEGNSSGRQMPEYLKKAMLKEKEKFTPTITESDVVEKDRKLFEKLQKKVQKLENLRTEIERITAKENDQAGLTEGQQQTIARNEKRIKDLEEEVEQIEDTIRERNAQREGSAVAKRKKRKAESEEEYNSEEDDFYDRTGTVKKKRHAQGNKATSATLKAETVESLESQLAEVTGKLQNLHEEIEELSKKAASSEETGEVDSLDAFMMQTSKDVVTEMLLSKEKQKKELGLEKKRIETLLSIARPALPGLVAAVPKTKEAQPASETRPRDIMVQKPIEKEASPSAETEVATRPTSPSKPASRPEAQSKKIVQPTNEQSGKTSPKTAVAAKSKGPLLPQGPAPATESPRQGLQVRGAKRPLSPAQDATRIQPSSAPRPTSKVRTEEEEEEDVTWVPPSNQRGDGRTPLNDKYGY